VCRFAFGFDNISIGIGSTSSWLHLEITNRRKSSKINMGEVFGAIASKAISLQAIGIAQFHFHVYNVAK
jgi:hypothetical protein